jgi:hypothetical protein
VASVPFLREASMDFNIGMVLWLWIIIAPVIGAMIVSAGR